MPIGPARMPLFDHLGELRRRLTIVVVCVVIASGLFCAEKGRGAMAFALYASVETDGSSGEPRDTHCSDVPTSGHYRCIKNK